MDKQLCLCPFFLEGGKDPFLSGSMWDAKCEKSYNLGKIHVKEQQKQLFAKFSLFKSSISKDFKSTRSQMTNEPWIGTEFVCWSFLKAI